MNESTPGNPPSRLWIALAALAFGLEFPPAARAADSPFVAVASQASSGYVRTKLPDGSFQPENFVFGKGGYLAGNIRDASIDKMGFLAVARVMQQALATQDYVNSRDPKATKLLIMVYWGTTTPPDADQIGNQPAVRNEIKAAQNEILQKFGRLNVNEMTTHSAGGSPGLTPQFQDYYTAIQTAHAFDQARDRADQANAALLGYTSWWMQTAQFEGTPFDAGRRDMIDELEEPRYFVVLMAYDFQKLWKEKKPELLWVTRFSIPERDNEFDRQLGAMADEAARYFGQDSHGLTHKPLPKGSVELGELKVLGTTPQGGSPQK